MKLAQDQQVIEALKQILQDYDYLAYDETWPCHDELRIKVTDLDVKRYQQVVIGIRNKLANATNRKYSSPYLSHSDNLNEEWTEFILYEENDNEVKCQ